MCKEHITNPQKHKSYLTNEFRHEGSQGFQISYIVSDKKSISDIHTHNYGYTSR